MNKTLVILIIIVAIIFIAFIGYFLWQKVFRKKIDCNSSILFIGDSITAFTSSYADQLAKMCPGLRYKKIALVAEQTGWMLGQLYSELNTNKYDAVVILGGTNDIFGSNNIERAKNNLQEMYSLAKSKGSIVVAIAPPSINYYSLTTPQKQFEYADLKEFIRTAKNVDHYFDFAALTNSSSMFGIDGLHPNSYVHSLLANEIFKKLFKS